MRRPPRSVIVAVAVLVAALLISYLFFAHAFHHPRKTLAFLLNDYEFFDDIWYAPGFSHDAFDQVNTGMTSGEVVALIGSPLWVNTDPWINTGSEDTTWLYTLSEGQTFYVSVEVQFAEDRVVRTHRRATYGF